MESVGQQRPEIKSARRHIALVFGDVGRRLDAEMEYGSEEEGVAGRPEERAVAIQFDHQRYGAVGRDIQFVSRSAVRDEAQSGSGRRKRQQPGAAVGRDRAMGHADTAEICFESGLLRGRAGEAQANLAIGAGGHNRIGEWSGGGVYARISQQIDLEWMLLKLGGKRLPAGRIVHG